MDKKQKAEALNEVTVFKELKFPYVISYRESFIENGHLCIVMDYADGGDLYSKIAKQKEIGVLFPESLVVNWFIKMALALRYVHDRKILHRDLKTQNIFLTTKGDVKIGDFGIARVLQHTYDCANTAIGTPYYLSPEICQEKPYNQKSDIWSLGCILYEMTTLNHAFDSSNMKGLVQKILKGSYPPIPPQYSQDLRQVIASLLIKDPSKRPSMKRILELPFLKARINDLLTSTVNEFGQLGANPIYRIMREDDPRPEDEQEPGPFARKDNPKAPPGISIVSVRRDKISPSKASKPASRPRREKENPRKDDKHNYSDEEEFEQSYGQLITEMKKCLNDEGEDEKDILDKPVNPRFLEMNGKPLSIPGISERDTVGSKIEALRYYLEKVIGEDFFKAYKLIANDQTDNDYEQAARILGPKSKYIPLVVQLIVCEDGYY
jgi:NIMA (never in mitosis gene a)-related kinase